MTVMTLLRFLQSSSSARRLCMADDLCCTELECVSDHCRVGRCRRDHVV